MVTVWKPTFLGTKFLFSGTYVHTYNVPSFGTQFPIMFGLLKRKSYIWVGTCLFGTSFKHELTPN
jgi:hypothetical protein